jgi:hypothetical protein
MASPHASARDIAAFDEDDDVERSDESATLLGDSTIRNRTTSTTNARNYTRSRPAPFDTHTLWSAAVDTWTSLTVTRPKSASGTWSSLSLHRFYAVLAVSLLMVTWLSTYSTSGLASSQESEHKDRPTKGKTTFAPPQYHIPLSNDDLPRGYKKAPAKVSDMYLRRGKALSDELRQEITQQWGMWNFIEAPRSSNALRRPTWDEWRQVVDSYPNGDVPLNALMVPPTDDSSSISNSTMNTSGTSSTKSGSAKTERALPKLTTLPWQIDTAYLSQWLPHAMALAERSLEGILGEYGHSKFDQPNETFATRSYMFSTSTTGYHVKRPPGNAGYATSATLAAIQRRLMHAIVTQSSFTMAMGGHSAAAGHGNHFQQSYTLQVQRVLEPVLARLGVYHQSHNFGVGGMGTIQNALGSADLYGPELDVIIWDSSMTENEDSMRDLFARTAFLTGDRVPVLWGVPEWGRYDDVVPGAGHIHTTFWGTTFVRGMIVLFVRISLHFLMRKLCAETQVLAWRVCP